MVDDERLLRTLEDMFTITGTRGTRHVNENENIRARMVLASGHEVPVAREKVIELGLLARRKQRRHLVTETAQAQREGKRASEAIAIRIDMTANGNASRSVKQLNAIRVIELRH